MLKRHRWWFLGTFLVIAACVAGVYSFVPHQFTARAAVWLDCSADPVANWQLNGCSDADRSSDRIVEMTHLASSAITSGMLARLSPAARKALFAANLTPRTLDAAATLRANLHVQAVKRSDAVIVSYHNADPAIAIDVTNQIVAAYIADRRETGARKRRIEFYRSKAADTLDELRRNVASADSYRATTILSGEGDLEELRRKAAMLDVRLTDARAHEVTLGETSETDTANGSIRQLKAQLAQLIASRVKLQERYGPLHPDMISMNARVESVIDRISVRTARLQAIAEAARRAHERLDVQTAEAARRTKIQLDLDAAATSAAARYNRSLQDLRGSEASAPNDAHVLVTARLSPTTSPANLPTVAAIGLIAALVGAGGMVALRELGGPGLRSKGGAERKLGLTVLGMVPETPQVKERRVVDLILSDNAPEFVAAFKDINLRLGLDTNFGGGRVIAITSAFEAEGKTTVAIGIARLAALEGLRVLLIDCDLRRPAATRTIAPDAAASLADVLAGKAELADARVRDNASGAWVLASGIGRSMLSAASGVVGTPAMLKLIEDAKAEYQLVVLDMAPVLALVETRIAAAFADRVMLVARWRTTPVKAIRLALDMLNDAGSEGVALILTRIKA